MLQLQNVTPKPSISSLFVELYLCPLIINQQASVDCPDVMDASWRTLTETEELDALVYDEDSVLNKMSDLFTLLIRTGINFDYNFEPRR